MEELTNYLLELGRELQALGSYKLQLLQPEIDRLLMAEEVSEDEISHLLDELYDPLMWGSGRLAYEKLLQRLEQVDQEAATFYANELKELTEDSCSTTSTNS